MTVRLMVLLALAAALIGAAVWFYQQGGQAVLISIERQNNVSGDKSDQARSNYDLCLDGGGVYDFAAGKCRRPAPRGRH